VGRTHRVAPAAGTWRFIRAARRGEGTPPRTSRAQTIVDLSGVLTTDRMAALVAQAIARHHVSAQAIMAAWDATPRHPGRSLLPELVADADRGVSSALEWHYLREVERAHGLPAAERQAKPAELYAVDVLHRRERLIIELDSMSYHRGLAATVDLERDRFHAAEGYLTVRFTWPDVVNRPCRTAATVALHLRERGWTGHPRTCPRCPPDVVLTLRGVFSVKQGGKDAPQRPWA